MCRNHHRVHEEEERRESGMSEVWKTSDNSKEWICWSGFIHKGFTHQNNNNRDGRDLHILQERESENGVFDMWNNIMLF